MDYLIILFFLIFSLLLSTIIMLLSNLISFSVISNEKLSSYECGFNPFNDCMRKFDVQFYLVAILFIIFDLEISFLFPWSVSLPTFHFFGFWVVSFFLFILTLGFIYEWKKGVLDWC